MIGLRMLDPETRTEEKYMEAVAESREPARRGALTVPFDLAQEPQFGEPPVAFHRVDRHGERRGLELRALSTAAGGQRPHLSDHRADGTLQTVTTSDPGRLLLTGQPADLSMMDATQLRGIARTAPYFQNNSAAILEEVLDHYDAFFRRAARLNPPPNLPPILSSTGSVIDPGFVTAHERPALLAYLRMQ
jgi:hypothetical protein